jgi:hypothetical protein
LALGALVELTEKPLFEGQVIGEGIDLRTGGELFVEIGRMPYGEIGPTLQVHDEDNDQDDCGTQHAVPERYQGATK